MPTDERTLATAFTYAWWLTGDEDAAAAAASAACAAAPSNRDAGPHARATALAALLRDVRARALPDDHRTMCPASEVALLHDAGGVALDVAADLVGIPLDDARTELAHGRLEALVETASGDFPHPERLGGLATGNPADIAHARQCRSCADARAMLSAGRAAMRDLPKVPVPKDFLSDEVRPLTSAARPSVAPGGEAPVARPADDAATDPRPVAGQLTAESVRRSALDESTLSPSTQPSALDTTEPLVRADQTPDAASDQAASPVARVIDRRGEVTEPAAQTAAGTTVVTDHDTEPVTPRRPYGLFAVAILCLVGVVAAAALLIADAGSNTTTSRDDVAPTASQSPTTAAVASPTPSAAAEGSVAASASPTAATDTPSDTPAPAASAPSAAASALGATSSPSTADGFVVDLAGIIPRGSLTPVPSGATISPGETVRLSVAYQGAEGGVVLIADWTIDGQPFRQLTVTLSSRSSTHIFGAAPGADGWPVGNHEIVLSADGALLATVEFAIA